MSPFCLFRRTLIAACSLSLIPNTAHSQITNVTSDQAAPVPGVGHNYIKMLNETVNPATGSVSIRISVPIAPGRGITVPFSFGYDSNVARHKSGPASWTDNASYLGKGGWSYAVPYLNFQSHQITYNPGGGGAPVQCTYYVDF